jgi:hypothetical protein
MAEQLQSSGYLLKKEKLAPLASDYPHKVMLLESSNPYPGFYDEYFLPTTARERLPKSVYIVLRNFDISHEDDFIRMTMHIKEHHNLAFDAALCSISLFNEPAISIRVSMDNYSELPLLIGHYQQVGVKFLPIRPIKTFQSLIKIRRFFDIHKLGDGIFKDNDKADTFYIKVSRYLKWDDFERLTITIRNNFDHKSYDAAQAILYNKNGVIELVRIYDQKSDIAVLQSLKLKYETEIARL